MSARIFPFLGSSLPEIVYLDTSFVWEIYNPHADAIRQAECTVFLDRLYQAEVMMVINSFVIQELRHAILVSIYRQEARSRRMGWPELFRQDKTSIPAVIQSVQQVEVLVDAIPLMMRLPIHLDVTTDAAALDCMETYNLDSADAYHVAIARADEINSLVTLDQGAVDTLNLYTCDPVLLQNQTTETEILPFDAM